MVTARDPADRIDPQFRALPLTALADAALGRARELGAEHADLRVERIVSQQIRRRDGRVTGIVDATSVGLAVRVVVDGVWGFASHVELTPARAGAPPPPGAPRGPPPPPPPAAGG